jgi:hypothetical protein
MLVRLKVKLADRVDGIDISRCREGDILELSDRDAALLIAEGWGVLVEDGRQPDVGLWGDASFRSVAAERSSGSGSDPESK